MTISTTSNVSIGQGNGLTTSFNFPFLVPAASDLVVSLTDSNGTITALTPSQYSIAGIGNANGGSVTYPLSGSPIPQGTYLTIQRVLPYQQLTDLVNQSGYYPDVVEGALDNLEMQIQQLAQDDALSLKVPLSATPPNLLLPGAQARANTLVGFDANGNVFSYGITASVGAGNMTAELGTNGNPGFKAGSDFVAGTTQSLTLSQAYGSVANVFVAFDGAYQERDSYQISGNTITFGSFVGNVFVPAAIPLGVTNVDVVGGTTLSMYVPPNGSVGSAQLQNGAVTSAKIQNGAVGPAQLQWGTSLAVTVDSIAALGALSVATYARAFVTGYYAEHDGGGGAYAYDAAISQASANGGTLIAAAGGIGCWVLQHTGIVSSKQFGAKGDGVTDDAATLQTWINASASVGFKAFLAPGTYAIPVETLTIPAHVIIEGVREQSILKRTTDTAVPVLQATSVSGVQIRDILITTTAGAASTTTNSIATGSQTFTVPAGLTFNVGDMLIVIPTANASNYMVGTITAYSGTSLTINITTAYGSGSFSAWVLGKYTNANCAIQLTGCTQTNVQRVRVTGNFYLGITSQNGTGDQILDCEAYAVINRAFYIYATSGASLDCEIRGCRANGNSFTQYGINLNGSTAGSITNAVIANNKVDNVQFQGIAPGGAIFGCTVTGNVIDGVLSAAGVGIEVDQANGFQPQRVSVSGNIVLNAASSGIYMSNSLYSSITGNSIVGGVYGILVGRTASNSAFFNQVVGNNVSGYSSTGILFNSDASPYCGQSTCTGNSCTGTGSQIGIASNVNTDRIAFVGNVSIGNATPYSTLGTNHASAANI